MKDWKTWAIVALAAWCALLTYHPVRSYVNAIDQKRSHEEWKRTKGAEYDRELEKIKSETRDIVRRTARDARKRLDEIKESNPNIYVSITNDMRKRNFEGYKRMFKDCE